MSWRFTCAAHGVAMNTDQVWEAHLLVDDHSLCGFVITTEGNHA